MWLIFGYNMYYPHGGMNDLIAAFNTEKEADDYIAILNTGHHYDEIEKVNTDNIKIGKSYGSCYQ